MTTIIINQKPYIIKTFASESGLINRISKPHMIGFDDPAKALTIEHPYLHISDQDIQTFINNIENNENIENTQVSCLNILKFRNLRKCRLSRN